MTNVEVIYRLTELIGGIGEEIADGEWSDHSLTESLSEIAMFDAIEAPAAASAISKAAEIIATLAEGAEAHGFADRVGSLSSDIDALSTALANVATKASDGTTAASTLRQSVISELANVAALATDAANTLTSNIDDDYNQFEALHLLTTQSLVEELIITVRDQFMANVSGEIEKAISGFSDEASATVTNLTDIRADLVQQLIDVQQKAANQLNAGLSTLADNAQQAIEQRALNTLRVELANATESIAVGQSLQIGLSTGPWLPTIAAAKAAMQMLP